MARVPATAIKLDSSTAFGQAFSAVKDRLPNPVSPDYLHISTTVIEKLAGNQANMSPQQEAIYKSIINEAAQKMRNIKSFKTGKIDVAANGSVILEIDSPEMKKIIETMQSKLNSHGFVTIDKANPIHITLQKGTSPRPKPDEIAALKKAVQSPEIQALSHRDYSVSNAKFGAVEYSGNRVDMKPGWNNVSMVSPVKMSQKHQPLQPPRMTPRQIEVDQHKAVSIIQAFHRANPQLPKDNNGRIAGLKLNYGAKPGVSVITISDPGVSQQWSRWYKNPVTPMVPQQKKQVRASAPGKRQTSDVQSEPYVSLFQSFKNAIKSFSDAVSNFASSITSKFEQKGP